MEAGLDELVSLKSLKQLLYQLDAYRPCLSASFVLLYVIMRLLVLFKVGTTYKSLSYHRVQKHLLVVFGEQADEFTQVW